jgi:hypothetical protein
MSDNICRMEAKKAKYLADKSEYIHKTGISTDYS